MDALESVLKGYQETLLADFLMHIGDRDASLRHYAKICSIDLKPNIMNAKIMDELAELIGNEEIIKMVDLLARDFISESLPDAFVKNISETVLAEERLGSIKRDEIEDANEKILKTIQKGKGQSRETKINLAVELDVSKSAKQVSTIANRIFGMDVDRVSEIASEFAIEGIMEQDKLKELEGAMVGIFGEEQLSEETKQALEMWDELEAGEIDEDKFFHEVEKSTEKKMVVKRDEEIV